MSKKFPNRIDTRRLRVTRFLQGLTFQAISARSGLSTTSLSWWENGTHSPTTTSLRRLAEAMGVSREFLRGIAGPTVEKRQQLAAVSTEDLIDELIRRFPQAATTSNLGTPSCPRLRAK